MSDSRVLQGWTNSLSVSCQTLRSLIDFRVANRSLHVPQEADPWTPGVLAHLDTPWGVCYMQNNRSVPLEISPHCYTLRCPGPPRMSATARERTYVAARRATRVGDRSHAQSSRRGTGTNHIRHREVTGRRYTGLLVTCSRPIESTHRTYRRS